MIHFSVNSVNTSKLNNHCVRPMCTQLFLLLYLIRSYVAWIWSSRKEIDTTFEIVLAPNTSGFGKFDGFTTPSSRHIPTEVMHCTHVTNSGASKFTVSPLSNALFTKTVTIDVNLFQQEPPQPSEQNEHIKNTK